MAVPLNFNLRNPRTQTLAGNSFYTVTALTNWDAGHYEFVNGVDGKAYGTVYVPDNIVPGSPTIKLVCAANATTGNVVLNVSFLRVASGATVNGSFTASTAQTVTVPGTAYQRFDVSFTANLTTPVTTEEYVIEIYRNGASVSDTLAVNLWLLDAILLT